MYVRTIGILTLLVSLAAVADCPKEAMDKFQGKWAGNARILSAGLAPAPIETVSGEYQFEKCERFSVNLEFADGQKNTRTQNFKAEWSENEKLWKLSGKVMDGVLRQIDANTYLASFKTAFTFGPAFCDELINISQTSPLQITRAIECFDKQEGGELKLFKISHETKE